MTNEELKSKIIKLA